MFRPKVLQANLGLWEAPSGHLKIEVGLFPVVCHNVTTTHL